MSDFESPFMRDLSKILSSNQVIIFLLVFLVGFLVFVFPLNGMVVQGCNGYAITSMTVAQWFIQQIGDLCLH